MKTKILISLGTLIGTGAYDFIKLGMESMDWFRPPFVAVITFLLLLIVPKKYIEKKE